MALKQSNKNRKKEPLEKFEIEVSDIPEIEENLSWTPLYGLAKKETDQDVEDVQNMWKPIPKIHKET